MPRSPRPRRSSRSVRLAIAVSLALVAALGLVSLPSTPAQAAVRTAALVGSLQSELGCPGDWQPECATTELAKDATGTTYSAVFSVPQGSWEFKVALNDSRDESYRADGTKGDANSPLVLAGTTDLRVVYDDTTHKTTVTPTDLGGDRVTTADRRLATDSLRNGLTRERFYFVLADRFANGSAANDRGGLTGDRLATGYDPTDKGFYHGGDLKGVTDKLDYIKGLGHDVDLVDAVVQEPSRAGQRGRRQRRLPRLLDHRLHPDRPAPGHQRGDEVPDRQGPRQGHEGLLRHHHQPHSGRDRLRQPE